MMSKTEQAESAAMRVGYLVNQYPMPSHTFIRTEILAVEQQGVAVSRFSVRGWDAVLADELDLAERRKTQYLLRGGIPKLVMAFAAAILRRPARVTWALLAAVASARSSRAGLIKHLAYLLEACLLDRWSRKAGISHLHAHFGTNSADVALYLKRLTGIPFSFTVHGPAEFDMPNQILLGRKVADASFVAAITSFCRSQLYRWARLEDWPKIAIVHCGLDTSFLDAEPVPPPRARRLVCVGRLCEQKGQLLLVEAVAALRERGRPVTLVLAGEGPMRADLEAAIARFGVEQDVTITGVLSNAEVRTALTKADAMVLPSFAEGLPVVIMEALALGRPVVSTMIAGIPELVRDGQEGFLVPAGDREALVGAIERMFALSPADYDQMAEAGRLRVRERHSALTEAAKLVHLFRSSARR